MRELATDQVSAPAARRPVCSVTECDRRVVARKLCHKHYQQAWSAGEFENAPLPSRTPAPTVCPPDHKHGESAVCYIHHQCRCDSCRDLRRDQNRRRSRLKAYGRFDRGLVDAAPVREHMMRLTEFGIGYKRVAKLAGLGVTTVRNLLYGRQEPGPRYGEMQKHVSRLTAERILGIEPVFENLADGGLTATRGTRRRVHALVANGWSFSKLAARLNLRVSNFTAALNRDHVTKRFALAVGGLYEELWDQVPPRATWHDRGAYSRSINLAARNGWVPPIGWDDIDTDRERRRPTIVAAPLLGRSEGEMK